MLDESHQAVGAAGAALNLGLADDDRGTRGGDVIADGQKEIVELLIAGGTDVNAKNGTGLTPLDYAKRHPEIANLLRKHGGKRGEELKAEGK